MPPTEIVACTGAPRGVRPLPERGVTGPLPPPASPPSSGCSSGCRSGLGAHIALQLCAGVHAQFCWQRHTGAGRPAASPAGPGSPMAPTLCRCRGALPECSEKRCVTTEYDPGQR